MTRDIPALIAFLGTRAAVPHEWGRKNNDCLSFIAGAVKAQSGRDPAKGLTWTSKASAMRLLRRLGAEAMGRPAAADECIEAVLDARFERIPVAYAHRGDIAACPDAELGLHPFIVEGATLCAPGDRGLMRAPRSAAVAAWSAVSSK